MFTSKQLSKQQPTMIDDNKSNTKRATIIGEVDVDSTGL